MIENGGNDMALQFILGSARSGKTDFIYDQMIKDSMEHEDEEFFFIVPDQSTLKHKNNWLQDIHVMERLTLMWWDFSD